MNTNIITMGFSRGKHVLFICNQIGLDQLPNPMRIEKGEGWHELNGEISKSFYVWIEATIANIISLIMLELITHDDANKILEGVNKPVQG